MKLRFFHRNKFRFFFVFIICSFFLINEGFSQSIDSQSKLSSVAFVQGAEAFKKGEWISSVFLFRKALTYSENYNAETLYMLITAEMYAGEYKSAFNDCEQFIQNFYDSPYISYILYHKGRALFYLGEYEKAILVLSDYCHQYPEHEMYAAALFWIAESFYASYNYVESKSLYERILNEFPDDPKASAAQYRIETINQRSREEKLLYLLRETGEEYLSAKEAYERQLKLYSSETAEEIRKKLINLQERNKQLEAKLSEYEKQLQSQNQEKLDMQKKYESVIKNLENDVKSIKENQNAEFIRQLKEKASQTQQLLDKKTQAE